MTAAEDRHDVLRVETPKGHPMLKYITEIRVFSIFAILTFGAVELAALLSSRLASALSDPLVVMILGCVVGAVSLAIVKALHLIR